MALAFVEGQVKDSGVTPATTGAFANTIVASQLLVAYGGMDGGATGLMTGVSDNKGNTWTHVTGMDIANGGGTLAIDCWYCVPTTGGSGYTVSVAFNDLSTNMNAVIQYFNGFTGTPTLDKLQHSTNAASTNVTSGATAATTQATEIVIGGAVHSGTTSAFSLGAGYTNLTQSSVSARQTAMESKVVGSTGAQTATMTIALSRASNAGVATFYDAVSAPSASIAQIAATITAAGGTQTVATIRNVTIAQAAATVTATGGAQTAQTRATIAQVAANVTATGGTQVIATVRNSAITQLAATITATGGTQAVAATRLVVIVQLSATVTVTGGTQAVSGGVLVSAAITQVAANVTASAGTQTVAAANSVVITQLSATLTATTYAAVVNATQVLAPQDFLIVRTTTDSLLVRVSFDSLLVRVPSDSLLVKTFTDALFVRGNGDSLSSSTSTDSIVVKSYGDSLAVR